MATNKKHESVEEYSVGLDPEAFKQYEPGHTPVDETWHLDNVPTRFSFDEAFATPIQALPVLVMTTDTVVGNPVTGLYRHYVTVYSPPRKEGPMDDEYTGTRVHRARGEGALPEGTEPGEDPWDEAEHVEFMTRSRLVEHLAYLDGVVKGDPTLWACTRWENAKRALERIDRVQQEARRVPGEKNVY